MANTDTTTKYYQIQSRIKIQHKQTLTQVNSRQNTIDSEFVLRKRIKKEIDLAHCPTNEGLDDR